MSISAPSAPPPLEASPLAAVKNSPIAAIKRDHAELLAKYPPPWVVGPYGDVWVASDVEQFDPDKEGGREKIEGPNGTFWRTNPERLKVGKPRQVFEPTDQGIAALTVAAVNLLA